MAAIIPNVKHPYLYLPDGWDTGWKASKATAGSTPIWVTACGDSITAGQKSTTYLTQGFCSILRDALQAKYGSYADFHNATLVDSLNLVNVPPLPWTFTGAFTLSTSTGFGGTLQTTAAGTATYVTPKACTAVDLYYYDLIAGSWSWTLDGGAPTTVTPPANGGVKKISIGSGLANTTHTIVITWISGVLRIAGASSVYSSTGVGFGHIGVGGLQTTAYISTGDTAQSNLIGRGTTEVVGFPNTPHLLMIGMGINDCNTQNIGPEQWFYTYRRLILGARRTRPGTSVLLFSPAAGDSIYGDGGALMTNGNDWGSYVAAARRLAMVENCAHLDTHAKWGSTPVAQGFVTAGDVHPTIAGHADIAGDLTGVIV